LVADLRTSYALVREMLREQLLDQAVSVGIRPRQKGNAEVATLCIKYDGPSPSGTIFPTYG